MLQANLLFFSNVFGLQGLPAISNKYLQAREDAENCSACYLVSSGLAASFVAELHIEANRPDGQYCWRDPALLRKEVTGSGASFTVTGHATLGRVEVANSGAT